MTDTPRITKQLAKEAETYALATPNVEVCGIFFFPQERWGLDPMFIELPNRHPIPQGNFKIDYVDVEDGILDYGSETTGEFTIFHTHPAQPGQPSREDVKVAEIFAKEMDGHPFWRPTFRHLILSLWDNSWWWFDLESFGRIGWEWPDV